MSEFIKAIEDQHEKEINELHEIIDNLHNTIDEMSEEIDTLKAMNLDYENTITKVLNAVSYYS